MLDQKALREACKLVFNSPQTKPFVEYLSKERERCRDLLETSQHPNDTIRALQGEAQAYKKILDMLETLAQ